VEGIDREIRAGEIVGVVAESGSGKSTRGRMLLGIEAPTDGEVLWQGAPMPKPATSEWRALRRDMHLIFQDPLAAPDRRMTIADQIAEPLEIHRLMPREQIGARVTELMEKVGLRADQADRYPLELSGGLRQRVVMARALAMSPKFLVCDEPVSALDVSIQAQVVNLLYDLKLEEGLTMVFISHDLKVVRNLCDRVVVMYLGRIVEEGPADEIFANPRHPYTQALVSSVPSAGRGHAKRILLQGEPPNPASRPSGCAFHPRCHLADAACKAEAPALIRDSHRLAACLKLRAAPNQDQVREIHA